MSSNYRYHAFLSYSRQDIELMQPLRDYLRGQNLVVWTDEGIEPGTPEWVRAIEDAIKKTGTMIVLATPNSNKSEWVQREIGYAETHKVRIIPFFASGEVQDDISLRLINHQRIDARQDFDGKAQELAATIRRFLGIDQSLESQFEYQIIIPETNFVVQNNFSGFDKLPEQQKQILDYMNSFWSENGYGPTYREIVEAVDFTVTTSVVSYHIEKLEEAGFIGTTEKSARTMRLTRPIPKYDVFLSYSLADREVMLRIREILVEYELRVRTSEDAGLNTIGSTRIQEEIKNSYCMMVLLSPFSKYSTKVIAHLIYLQEAKNPLIPTLIRGSEIDAIPFLLPAKFYDVRDEFSARIPNIADTIRKIANIPPKQRKLF